MTDNPFTDPGWIDFVKRAEDDLVPKLRDAGATISLAPTGETDIKFAVELGLSIMMNKPIVVIVHPGQVVASGLLDVADLVVVADLDDHETSGPVVAAAIGKITEGYRRESRALNDARVARVRAILADYGDTGLLAATRVREAIA
jgi:hypothetical protein